MTILERELAVLEALTAYRGGSGPLSALEEEAAAAVFELKFGTTDPLVDLLGAIELYLAEYTSGDITEDELRANLAGLAHNYYFEINLDGSPQTRQRADTTSVTVGEADSWSRPGTTLSVAFATQAHR
jgi:hypothetical protein